MDLSHILLKHTALSSLRDILLPLVVRASTTARSIGAAAELVEALVPHHLQRNASTAWLTDFVESLRSVPQLSQFDGLLHGVGGSASRLTYESLATWLLRRSEEAGPEIAVQDLENYLSNGTVAVDSVVGVGGLDLAEEVLLSSDARLVPWDKLAQSSARKSLEEHGFFSRFSIPRVALIHRRTLPRTIKHQDEPGVLSVGTEEENDILLVLTLIRPVAPVPMAYWFEVPKSVPILGGGMILPHVEGTTFPRLAPETFAADAPMLVSAWKRLPSRRQDELRVPLSRLNSAIRRSSAIDAAIDLGIALEATLLSDLDDDRGELAFRMRIRAARWLGNTPDERRAISGLVRDIYSLRSTAVHAGRIAAKLGSHSSASRLQEGFELSSQLLRRLLLEPAPDWNEVVIA